MARTIKDIQQSITDALKSAGHQLTASAAAEWRLWANTIGTAIRSFETLHDEFRREIDDKVARNAPGTIRWCVEMAKRFQNGHEYKFDPETLEMYYETDDPASRIVSVVSVTTAPKLVNFKVAKLENDRITRLTEDELHNFSGYISRVMQAGTQATVISTNADLIRYEAVVYFDPSYPATAVREQALVAADDFRTLLDFNSMFYRQRFIDCLMDVEGVVTVDLVRLERKSSQSDGYTAIDKATELASGYFDYGSDCVLTARTINDMES